MPAIWARAVRLTRRQIEATTPLTRAEILSSRDQIAAEYAVNVRRLEMGVGALRRRVADQMATLTRQGDAIKTLTSERDRAREEAALLTDRLATHTARDRGVDLTADRIAKLESENRELVEDRDRARADLAELEARTSAVVRERTAFLDDAQTARQKLADVEASVDDRLAAMRSALSEKDLEVRQARREAEEARAARMEAAARISSGASEVASLRAEREALTLRLAALQTSLQLAQSPDPDLPGDNASKTIEELEKTRAELDESLRSVMAERDTMHAQLLELERQVKTVGEDVQASALKQLRQSLTDLGRRFADAAEGQQQDPGGEGETVVTEGANGSSDSGSKGDDPSGDTASDGKKAVMATA
jgi:DNA repair exonuclease SbcCD ATPase subunit